jgi:hypothetical protein
MDTLCTFWSLFGSIWLTPEEVITEMNSIKQPIQLTIMEQIRQNGKKPVFVVVLIPFSYLDEFFHDFRIFLQVLVNI